MWHPTNFRLNSRTCRNGDDATSSIGRDGNSSSAGGGSSSSVVDDEGGARPQSVMGTLNRKEKVPLTPDQLKQGAKYVKKYPEFKKLNPDEGYRMHSAYQKSKVDKGLKASKGHMFSKEEKARVQSKQELRENLVNRYQNPNGPLPAY